MNVIQYILGLVCFTQTNSRTSDHNQSVFLVGNIQSYCDMQCGANPHTLCPQFNGPSQCTTKLQLYPPSAFQDLVINGHNGLRNRVAIRYNVANMRRMEWDEELAAMAEIWLSQCARLQTDSCATLDAQDDASYTLVRQNLLFLETPYLPEYFYANMIRLWYLEKWFLNDPTYGQNLRTNYTQMLNAEAWRIGCAVGSYGTGIALICNYYPIAVATAMNWETGNACAHCPRNLPRCSTYFTGLCTADRTGNRPALSATLMVSVVMHAVYCQYWS